MRDLNPRHPACKADTLTAELIVQDWLSELRSDLTPGSRQTGGKLHCAGIPHERHCQNIQIIFKDSNLFLF